MPSGDYYKHEQEVRRLVHEQEKQKLVGKADRWGLPRVGRGMVRGTVAKVRYREEPCEFGMLTIVDFELRDDPKQPGVPVRMNGTEIDQRVIEGYVLDVPDRNPKQRPIETSYAIFSWTRTRDKEHRITAFYPGRQGESAKRSRMLGMLALVVPGVLVLGAIAALHFVWHVLD